MFPCAVAKEIYTNLCVEVKSLIYFICVGGGGLADFTLWGGKKVNEKEKNRKIDWKGGDREMCQKEKEREEYWVRD